MVRTFSIFVVTLAVLGIGFFFVWRAQSGVVVGGGGGGAGPTVPIPVIPTLPAKSSSGANGFGPSSRPWVKDFEKGRLVSEFTAEECTPQKDGSFEVTKPVSRFYMTDGQTVQVKGDTGTVVTDNGGPKTTGANMFGGSNETPRNGILHHVHIDIFPSASATRSTTQMDTDNIKFDNDTLRMFTDPTTAADGTPISADMVPVTVRGDDYEMDGKGLTIRWNGIDGHLQLLEIAHGQRLLIKNPAKMSMPGMPPAEPSPHAAIPLPDMLASTDPGAVGLAKPAQPAAPKPPLPYRAVFNENVKVFQGDHQSALADTMMIDFLQGSSDSSKPAGASPRAQSKSTPTPAPVQTPSPAPVQGDVTSSTPAPVVTETPRTPAATAAKPATKPTTQPITIYWTGPLVVRPLGATPLMMPLASKQSVVRLVGSPAILTPEGAEVHAASVTYRTPDGAVQMTNSPAVPVVYMTQLKGAVKQVELKAGTLDYDPKTCLATITPPPPGSGPNVLTLPMANQPAPMTVGWSKRGTVHTILPTGQTQPTGVDQIDLFGTVAVAHPTFTLDSDELHINLVTAPKPHGKQGDTTMQPKLLTAIGNVDCKMLSPGKPTQGMLSDKMTIAMAQSPDDKTYPHLVIAEGNVYASDSEQFLKSDQLEISLLPKLPMPATNPVVVAKNPTTNPADDGLSGGVQMDTMHASSNVHAVMKDQSTADCDDLRVTTLADGKQLVELTGDRGATLANNKGSWLIGSVVHIAPERNVITVDGPGRMHTMESSASSSTKPSTQPTTRPTTPPRPVDISWTDSMNVDGVSNMADIVGHVIVHTIDTGGVSTVIGDKAHIDFIDAPKPATKPTTTQISPKQVATKQVATKQPTTKPTDADAVGMGNKQLKRLTMTGNMHGESVLKDDNGKLIRHAQLFGNQMVYTAVDHKAVIPGAGRMYIENHKPDHPAAGASSDSGNQGVMTITWKKQLTYDQLADVITIDGDTHTHFLPDQQKQKAGSKPEEKDQPMDLDAQELVVTLKNTAPVAPKVTPAPGSEPEKSKMQLSRIFAVGSVRFNAKAVDFSSHSIDFNPETQLLVARGSDQEPGETHSADGRGDVSFGELIYDVEKQEVMSMSGDVHGTMRR